MTLDWADTPFVKSYIDDGPWMDLSLEARGFFDELLKRVDRAGVLPCGRDVTRTAARVVNGNQKRVRAYIDELVADGCLIESDNCLIVRNYVAAQSSRASGRVRTTEHRARRRDMAIRGAVSPQNHADDGNAVSHGGNAMSRSRLDQTRLDHSPTENGEEHLAAKQEEIRFEPPKDDPDDLPQNQAIYAVMVYWREKYPEHKDAQIEGTGRGKAIKLAIANRRRVLKCNRRVAVEAVKVAIDQASRDEWLSGARDGVAKTELTAILNMKAFERLCKLADGESAPTPVTNPRRGMGTDADLETPDVGGEDA